jgi:hypothetical protein
MAEVVYRNRRVGTLVTLQFKRSIDKRIDVPTLHVDSTGIAHGGLDTESNAMRKIVNCVSGLGFAVREGLLARLALRLTNFLSECVVRRLTLSSQKVWESLGLRHFAVFRGAPW